MRLLERLGMVECKSMATPMEMNFKKLCGEVTGPDLANPFPKMLLIEKAHKGVSSVLVILTSHGK